jgi:ketopantoate hydroxymethyltransferase
VPNNTRRVGPYSNPDSLAKLDQRTKEARLVRETRADLVAHVGGAPSATQRTLIDQAVSLKLHIALMDRNAAETGGVMTEATGKQYLAWANALVRLMRELGVKAAPPRARTLADHIASRAAS